MNTLVHYTVQDNIATIRIDDGKRNALSPELLHELYQALDQAESDHAAIILTGRDFVFSAGFDLKVMKRGGMEAINMLRLGYSLPARILRYPTTGRRGVQRARARDGCFPDAVGRLRDRQSRRFQDRCQ